jgi:hypothetical protein
LSLLDRLAESFRQGWFERCSTLRRPEGVSIVEPEDADSLSLEGVTELCALIPFVLRKAAPSVCVLTLGGDCQIDEGTAHCFPSLRGLRIETRHPTDISWFVACPLESLGIWDRKITNVQLLRKLQVSDLRIERWTMGLDDVPLSVQRLFINTWGPLPVAELNKVSQCPRLETLRVTGMVRLRTLRGLRTPPGLKALSISTRSLDGIGRMQGLTSLRLARGTASLSPLLELAHLKEFAIDARRPPEDIQVLGNLPGLRKLTLDFGDINGFADLKSIAFLRTMPILEEVTIIGVSLIDRDLTPLEELPRLVALDLRGRFGLERELRLRQPNATVSVRQPE